MRKRHFRAMENNAIGRRKVLTTVGAAGMLGLAGCAGGDDGGDGSDGNDGGDGSDGSDGSDDSDGSDGSDGGTTTSTEASGTVRIGILHPVSGPLNFYGAESLYGFYSGLKYRGGDETSVPGPDSGDGEFTVEVGDVTYELLVRDTGGDSNEAQSLATNLVSDDDVDLLAGGTSSASALAIANNVATPAQVPYVAGPTAAASLTGSSENCSEWVFRTSENVAMEALSGGSYVVNETDISSVYIYFADYSFGQTFNQFYGRELRNGGVDVVGSTGLSPGYAEDWPGQLQKAADAGAEAILGAFTVATLPAMVETFVANRDRYDFRFLGGYPTLAGATAIGQTIVNNVDELTEETFEELNFGPFTTRYHWNQYDNEINDAFIDFHTEQYGYYPDLFSSGVFAGASAIDQAIQESGSTDGDDIQAQLVGMDIRDTPKGENGYSFQSYNNQARSAMTVASPIPTPEENSEFWSAAYQPGEVVKRYSKDQTTLKADDPEMTCSL